MASPIRMTLRRTLGQVRAFYSTAFALVAFFALAAALFMFDLSAAEGRRVALVTLWSGAVAPVLPLLAALLSMETWSDERRSGRIDLLLCSPVRERDLVLGKFLGVWLLTIGALIVFHAVTIVFLAVFAPELLRGVPLTGFLPGFAMLMLQSALWCAVSSAFSAICRHGAAAAVASLVTLVALPRGVWWAVMELTPRDRLALGVMPLDAHVFDVSLGLVSVGTVASYLLLTVVFLFFASKRVAAIRFVGRGARINRFSTAFVILLALVFAAEAVALAHRLDVVLDLPVGDWSNGERMSARTVSVLREAGGEIRVTAFLPRKDPRFRAVSHALRTLAHESEALGGTKVNVRYVDPQWDFGPAERLVRAGAAPESIVFERAHRMASLPVGDGVNERAIASAILKVTMPPSRRTVYWTCGHGEGSIEAYDGFGLSDIARDIASDGYRNEPITLQRETATPSDCALIVIAGAKTDFSREERERIERFVDDGGRLLVLLNSPDAGGISTILSKRGIRAKPLASGNYRTLSGTDVIVSEFGEHALAAPLNGSQLIFEKPVAFERSSAAAVGGAEAITYSELAKAGDSCVAVASERGGVVGDDLAIRPSRIVAIGDASFVMNGQLEARANANRDFFLNCVAYLAGSAAMTESGVESDRLVTRLDRRSRRNFAIGYVIVFPAVVFIILLITVKTRRRR